MCNIRRLNITHVQDNNLTENMRGKSKHSMHGIFAHSVFQNHSITDVTTADLIMAPAEDKNNLFKRNEQLHDNCNLETVKPTATIHLKSQTMRKEQNHRNIQICSATTREPSQKVQNIKLCALVPLQDVLAGTYIFLIRTLLGKIFFSNHHGH